MNRFVLSLVLLIGISLIISCTGNEPEGNPILMRPAAGSIRGNVSPINVYDAEITVLRGEEIITVVGVQDGIFQIDHLAPGAYDLRVSALGYVTNDAIKGVQVLPGEISDIGRAVIYPEDTGQFIPTRLTGVVFDTSTGAAIAQAAVSVECTEGICGVLDGMSDQAGNFAIAIWANLASVVTVEKAGYHSARIEIVGIPTGSVQSIRVALEKISD
ncbi:MAG: carboxypeptidase-like regulatory domain-containing protein [Candidatus Poribacteria bacterium]|nr:carboxypeptidase-like regulatory domain-containing protein [Candidatus Poribacteria bacterium]